MNIFRIVIIIGLAAHLVACSQAKPKKETVRSVKTQVVKLESTAQVRHIAGSIRADNFTQLSFAVPGTVNTVALETGEAFKKGQVLATLDKLPYQHRVKIAEGVLAEAEARLDGIIVEQKAKLKLLKTKDIGDVAYKDSFARYQAAKAKVITAKARLKNARRDLNKTNLVAPYNGYVVKRLAQEHMEMRAGHAIYDVYDPDQLELFVLLPENLVHYAKEGQIFYVQIPSIPGLKLKGKIKTVGVQATVANAFPVTVSLLQSNKRIKPGMTGELIFKFSMKQLKQGMLLPLSAFLSIDTEGLSPERIKALALHKYIRAEVFVYNPKTKKVHKRIASIAGLVGNRVIVYHGIKPGERVVVAGTPFLHDGQVVKESKGIQR